MVHDFIRNTNAFQQQQHKRILHPRNRKIGDISTPRRLDISSVSYDREGMWAVILRRSDILDLFAIEAIYVDGMYDGIF